MKSKTWIFILGSLAFASPAFSQTYSLTGTAFGSPTPAQMFAGVTRNFGGVDVTIQAQGPQSNWSSNLWPTPGFNPTIDDILSMAVDQNNKALRYTISFAPTVAGKSVSAVTYNQFNPVQHESRFGTIVNERFTLSLTGGTWGTTYGRDAANVYLTAAYTGGGSNITYDTLPGATGAGPSPGQFLVDGTGDITQFEIVHRWNDIAENNTFVQEFGFDFTVVPEPSGAALATVGLIGFLIRRRR